MPNKITPYLWFDNNAEEAMEYYVEIFSKSPSKNKCEITSKQMGPDGKLFVGTFKLNNQEFFVLNGGPQHFNFNESISFFVNCKTQAEVDYFWNELTSNGGEESMCGWLKDKFGLSWQIIPDALMEYIGGTDPKKSEKAMQAMLKMKKIVIADLKKAYEI